jgi:hypothetical protein
MIWQGSIPSILRTFVSLLNRQRGMQTGKTKLYILSVLKAYVWNRAHPKCCIMEGYTTEEVVECCTDYVKDEQWIGLLVPLHEDRLRGRRRMCQKTFVDRDYSLVSETHFGVLQQVTIAGLYIDEHLSE